MDLHNMSSFFPGLALNKSIEKLTFDYVNLECEELWNMLTPFFASSKALQCLEVKAPQGFDLRVDYAVMAPALRQFHSL